MKKILLFLSLFTPLIFAQSFQIKQITNLNADCRNLTCTGYIDYLVYYAFEAYTGNSSSVYFGRYYADADSFAVLLKVTDDNFMNINPKLVFTNDSVFVVYQTNKNGNWDIAYRVYKNNQLNPVYYVSDSSSDEVNPVVPNIHRSWNSMEKQYVSYERGNSVFIWNSPGLIETEVFHGDDTTQYSQVSLENPLNNGLYITARKVVNGKSFIVYKKYTNGWGNETVLVNAGNCHNPIIHIFNYTANLSYTNDLDSNIYLIEQFYQPGNAVKLFNDPKFIYDNFLAQEPIEITKMKNIAVNGSYTYKASRNDSLFIRLNKEEVGTEQTDTLINTKVINSTLYLGTFGGTIGGEVFYTIWEDSINGKVQIFGRRELKGPVGNVSDNITYPSTLTLYQNYPNPFNPTTTISYRLKEKGFVKLNVYDITGKHIQTLVSQTKDPGSYETQFNAKGLASGIYFYRIEVFGNNSSPLYSDIKKLVLLK